MRLTSRVRVDSVASLMHVRARGLAVLVVCLAGLGAAACAPEPTHLRYTMRLEMKPASSPMPPDPILGALGDVVAQSMVPGGSVEMTSTIGPEGMRLEWNKPLPGMPTGAVMNHRADGSTVLIDPTEKTYWKVATDAMGTMFPAGAKPKVTTSRTGQFETVQGERAEKVTFSIRLPLPLPPGVTLPPGMPTEVPMEGEAWVAARYKKYLSGVARTLPGLSSIGLDQLSAEGLQMKQILRSPIFAKQQLETVVTSVAEENTPPGRFVVPEGYREVPPPMGMGR
jgi:hypothetical protein